MVVLSYKYMAFERLFQPFAPQSVIRVTYSGIRIHTGNNSDLIGTPRKIYFSCRLERILLGTRYSAIRVIIR